MLTAIKVGNFKAFAEAQRIPLRPLTLIYGANSSGKSSVIHSLILARHALETGDLDVHRTNVGGESVDQGGFRQFIHRRDVSRRMEWSVDIDLASNSHWIKIFEPMKNLTIFLTIGIALDDQGRPHSDASPEIHSYEVLSDGKSLMRMSRRHDGIRLDFVEVQNPIFQNSIHHRYRHFFVHQHRAQFDPQSVMSAAVEKVIPQFIVMKKKFIPEGLVFSTKGMQGISTFVPQDFQDFASSRRTPEFSAFQHFIKSALPNDLDTRSQNDLEFSVRGFLDRINEFIRELARVVEEELFRLQYLGPLRSCPPRHLGFSQHHDPNWFAGGGYAWDVVRRDARVREQVNAWLTAPNRLQTPYELVLRDLVGVDQLEGPLLEGLEQLNEEGLDMEHEIDEDQMGHSWPVIKDPEAEAAKLRELIRSSDIEKLNDLIIIDRRSNTIVSHRDVGIGVSQVLPVLVGAYASQNQIIAIEQPEIHLHPALQADLGDLFLQSALGAGKNRFLIETHSEHLLLRVMRRMKETSNGDLSKSIPRVKPEDVCVLFVQPKGASSAVRHLELDKEGQLLDAWPGGFFEEGYRERFA